MNRPLAAALLLLAIVLPATPSAASQSPSGDTHDRIPNVRANNLAGQQIDLPAQLQGRIGILVLGFSKDARIPVRDWGRRLAADYFTSAIVSYFEMPVLASVPRLLRGVVLRQIAADVSDRGKPHFVPITADEPRWRDLAHYSDPDTAYLLVVDSSGIVRATLSGPLTDAAYAKLQHDIASLSAAR